MRMLVKESRLLRAEQTELEAEASNHPDLITSMASDFIRVKKELATLRDRCEDLEASYRVTICSLFYDLLEDVRRASTMTVFSIGWWISLMGLRAAKYRRHTTMLFERTCIWQWWISLLIGLVPHYQPIIIEII